MEQRSGVSGQRSAVRGQRSAGGLWLPPRYLARSRVVPVFAPVRVPPSSAADSPDDVAGLTLWLKADAGTYQSSGGAAASSDGDPVGEWQDQSSTGYHLGQTTAAAKPTLQTGEINSLPVIRFDGVDDLLTRAAAISALIAVDAYTLYLVLKWQAITNAAGTSYQNDCCVQDQLGYHGHYGHATAPSGLAANYDGSDDQVLRTIATGTAYGVRQMHSGGNLLLKYSGGAEGSAASGDTSVVTGHYAMGRNVVSPGPAQIDIGEVIYYNVALSAGNQTVVETYLAGRWGVTW